MTLRSVRFVRAIGCEATEYEVVAVDGSVTCAAFVRDAGDELRVVLCTPTGVLASTAVPVGPGTRVVPGSMVELRHHAVVVALREAVGLDTVIE